LDQAAQASPDRVAVIGHEVTLTYAQLRRHSETMAAAMAAAGVEPGQAVLVQLPNWWETLVVYHAVLRLGAVVNPVIPIYRRREVGYIVEQAKPGMIVVPETFRGFDHLGTARDVASAHGIPVMVLRPTGPLPPGVMAFPDDGGEMFEDKSRADRIAMLLYTSGTTGEPKGVLHSHETLVYECRSIARAFELGADDHVFMASPLTHVTGFLYGYILTAMLGSTSVLLDVWDPDIGRQMIEEHRCRFTVSATPFLQGLTDAYHDSATGSALRYFACGGADVPPDLIRRAGTVLGCHVSRIYGSSEFPTVSGGGIESSGSENAETDGRPIGPVEVRLDDVQDGVGELLARGPECFHGYLDSPLNGAAFTDDGFFRTGDLATIGVEGTITIRGRKKDVIIRNGENISAKEVEDLLYTHPAIADVAVIAVPDRSTGERACAVVVVRAGAELTLGDIREHLGGLGIAKQKFPEQLSVVNQLPRTASGKVQKHLLRQELTRTGS
jgi:cyclohexanecarboxylate-CoA ligase